MRARGVVLQGVLAAVGLVAAFSVWRRQPPETPGEVVVLEAPPGQTLVRVDSVDASGAVSLYRERRDGTGALWLALKPRGASQAPRELRANTQAEQLFARFLPLRATRSLGVLDDKALREVGLAENTRTLTLSLSGSTYLFPVAASASGWGSPYLWRAGDGHVFLLSPSLLPDLENGGWRLVDRTLHAFGADAYDALEVRAGGRSRAFRVRARGRGPVELVPQESPDAPDERARKWHERIWLLSPAHADFLGRGEEPPGGPPIEVLRVEYQRGAQALGHLRIARGAGGELYARTEYTAGWARLPPWADSLLLEAEPLLGKGP